MSFFRISLFSALVCSSLAVTACGGGGDDSTNNDQTNDSTNDNTGDDDDVTLPPDARPDSGTTPDSGGGSITGIGADCVPAMQGADCDAGMGCLSFPGATKGYCTAICVDSGSFMTDAQGAPSDPTPALSTGDATCTTGFTATTGSSACFEIVNLMPAVTGGALAPNTAYTFVGACGIEADASMQCPGNLVYNADADECFPQ